MLGGVLESVLGGCAGEHTRRRTWERLESLIGSVQSSRLGVYHRVQSGVYFRAYMGVYNKVHLAGWFQVCCMQHDV